METAVSGPSCTYKYIHTLYVLYAAVAVPFKDKEMICGMLALQQQLCIIYYNEPTILCYKITSTNQVKYYILFLWEFKLPMN